MKRLVSITLALVLLVVGANVYADMGKKLENHWSKSLIEKEFLAHYFTYLAKDNFKKFDPGQNILKNDFDLSLASFSKDYGLDITTTNMGTYENLTREEIVAMIGEKIIKLEELSWQEKSLPFKDIGRMNKDKVESLKLLHSLGIINGVTRDSFAPKGKVTQAEAIVILQRVRDLLEEVKEVEEVKEIEFNLIGIVQSYNSEEGLLLREEGNKILVTVTKMLPTPGYGVDVEKIWKDGSEYIIHLKITPPDPDAAQLQVITYKTLTIEINKSELEGQSPYVFKVEEMKGNLLK